MLFMGFPLAYALELTDPAQRAGLIGLCALLAVVNSATWLTNPLPARNSFTRPFILSHAALVAATVAYLVYAVSLDTPHAFMLTSYLLVAWVFQAPSRFIVAGLVPVTVIAGVAAYAQGEPLWMGWYLVLLCVFVGVARWRMERSAREHMRPQEAVHRPSGGSFGPSIVVFLALITFGGIGFLIASTSKRRGGVTEEVTRTSIDDSHKKVTQANHQLLAADEQVRSAADELDFARAQFGIAQTDEFARTLEFAKESVARCFETQKQMNGSTNPTARANLATSIMRDLGTSMNPLSNIQASFEKKRSEQATLPTRISDARERLIEQRADLERAKAELVSIAGIYPPQMLASLQDNPEQAAALLDTADKALGEAQQMVETDRARAESSLDTAHRALMMATHQTDAIFSAKSDLDAIHDRLGAAIGSISSDITDTSALKADSAVFDPLVSDAHAAIADGQAARLNHGAPRGRRGGARGGST